MQTVLELLVEAREKIADPERWCQFADARNSCGESVGPILPEACSWCSVGALKASLPEVIVEDDAELLIGAYDTLVSSIHINDRIRVARRHAVSYFNDTHIHAEVLAMWDKAIEMAEREYANGS